MKLALTAKRGKRNVPYIYDEVAQEIILNYTSTHDEGNGYYFIELGKMKNRYGKVDNEFMMVKMNYHWFWSDLKNALESAGVDYEDFATHDFRRCFARRVWEKYKDLVILQNVLNHSDPKTTIRYLEQSGLKNIDVYKEM